MDGTLGMPKTLDETLVTGLVWGGGTARWDRGAYIVAVHAELPSELHPEIIQLFRAEAAHLSRASPLLDSGGYRSELAVSRFLGMCPFRFVNRAVADPPGAHPSAHRRGFRNPRRRDDEGVAQEDHGRVRGRRRGREARPAPSPHDRHGWISRRSRGVRAQAGIRAVVRGRLPDQGCARGTTRASLRARQPRPRHRRGRRRVQEGERPTPTRGGPAFNQRTNRLYPRRRQGQGGHTPRPAHPGAIPRGHNPLGQNIRRVRQRNPSARGVRQGHGGTRSQQRHPGLRQLELKLDIRAGRIGHHAAQERQPRVTQAPRSQVAVQLVHRRLRRTSKALRRAGRRAASIGDIGGDGHRAARVHRGVRRGDHEPTAHDGEGEGGGGDDRQAGQIRAARCAGEDRSLGKGAKVSLFLFHISRNSCGQFC